LKPFIHQNDVAKIARFASEQEAEAFIAEQLAEHPSRASRLTIMRCGCCKEWSVIDPDIVRAAKAKAN
jgi:hypothetical protein